MHWRNTDTNLAEIHEKMSELVDKQVNVQKESLKKLPGFTQNSRKPTQNSRKPTQNSRKPTQNSCKPTKKCAMKMKKQTNKEKNDGRLKSLFGTG